MFPHRFSRGELTPRRRASPSHRKSRVATTQNLLRHELLEDRRLLSADARYAPPHYNLFEPGGFLTGPAADDPLDIAISYLNASAAKLGLSNSDLANAKVTDRYFNDELDVTHIYLRQTIAGREVAGADIGVHVTSLGQVVSVGGGFVPGLATRLATSSAVAMPRLGATEAIAAAAKSLNVIPQSEITVTEVAHAGSSYVLKAPGVSLDDVPAKLHYVPTPDGSAALSWQLIVRTPDNEHWYDLSIDTSSGEVVAKSDWADAATYTVLQIPTESPSFGAFQVTADPHLASPAASPFGWHDTNGTPGDEFIDTRGNNVDAHLDRDDNNIADTGSRPSGGIGLNFNSTFDPSLSPFQNADAAVTNLFYWNNVLHDVHYLYGFTPEAGNFQTNTYGLGGLGGDAVQADAQDGADVGDSNNANFGTPPDGVAPRMQMYEFTSTNPRRDSDMDAGIIIHEYGHGVSNRLTGGPANANALDALQSGGMGEGWSDWWALMLTQRTADETVNGRGMGTYVLGQAATGPGIRQFKYDFDIGDQAQETFLDYGTGPGQTVQVHAVGTRWCAALWDLNHLLIQKYGFEPNVYNSTSTAGNIRALHLVMNGLKLQPANPTFVQARDAILQADMLLNGGANRGEIWTAFARRGLGEFAATPGADSTTLTTSFVVPDLGLKVVSTVPAVNEIISTQPTSFVVNFSSPIIPATLAPTDLTVNGAPATNVALSNGDLTATFSYASSPVVTQGLQTMAIAADAIARVSDGDGVTAFAETFRYDITLLQVLSTAPPPGGVLTLPGSVTFDVNFNEAVAASSVQASDFVLAGVAGVSVTGATVLPGNTTVRFTLDGGIAQGSMNASIAAGAITDPFGNPGAAFSGTYDVDVATAPFAIPLDPKNPLGSLVYDRMVTGVIGTAGDVDEFIIDLDAGQTVSLLASATTSGLRPSIELFNPSNASLGSATATAAGQKAVLQAAPASAAGTYRVVVTGFAGTMGGYSLQLTLNAAIESEGALTGVGNNTQATAEDINGSFMALSTPQFSAQRGAVLGTTDLGAEYSASAIPFSFTNISATGSTLIMEADDVSTPLDIGFGFSFFGATYSSLFVSSNGLLTFGAANNEYVNSSLSSQPPEPAIAALWDDIYLVGSGAVKTELLGNAGSRQLVIQWDQVNFYINSFSDTLTFQAILYEGSNRIQFNYLDLTNGSDSRNEGTGATVGIKGGNPTNGRFLELANPGPNVFVGTGKSTLISPAVTTPDVYSFNLAAGDITSVAATTLAGGTLSIELRNSAGTLLAGGLGSAINFTSLISNYVATAAGTYFVHVTGGSNTSYSLVATRNIQLDAELNNTFDTAQPLGDQHAVLGHIGAPSAITLNATASGWWDATGFHELINTNYTAGLGDSLERRNFFVFSLFGITESIASASLTLTNGSVERGPGYNSPDPSETYTLFDVSTPLNTLQGNGSGQGAIFADLGTGVSLGTKDITAADNYLNVPVPFNGAGVSALNAARGSLFGIGGAVTTISGPADQNVFSFSGNGSDVKQLSLSIGSPEDWFSIELVDTAANVRLETSTPAGGPGQFVNNLNPRIELYSPSNALVAMGAPLADGRNEFIQFTPLATGIYRIRVTREGTSTGEYFLTQTTIDGDDQISEAVAAPPSGVISGEIASGGDVDMFAFTAGASELILFDIDLPSSNLDSYIRVFDAQGNPLASNHTGAGPHPEYSALESSLTYTFPAAGTYYLGVSAFPNTLYNPITGANDGIAPSIGAYTLTITSISNDPDDAISEAVTVALNTPVSRNISTGYDVDMFAVTVPASVSLVVDIDLPDLGLDSYIRLFDVDGNELAVNNNGVGPAPEFRSQESLLRASLAVAGTYFVGVSALGNGAYHAQTGAGDANASTAGQYTLTVSTTPVDLDDQVAEAPELDVGVLVTGVISEFTDVDLYAFTVSAAESMSVDVDLPGSALNSYVRLFDAQGNQLSANDDAAGAAPESTALESHLQFTFTTAGTYYIGVSATLNTSYNAANGDGDVDGTTLGSYQLTVASTGVVAAEFLVNTFTAGAQNYPSVAVDADGDYVIVWQSLGQDGDSWGIFAQRFNSLGAPQGDEFQVNTYTEGSQTSASVAIDGDGDFVVVWQSYGQDSYGYGVFAQRFNAAGEPQAGELPVNTLIDGPQTSPKVAMDPDGDFIVVWQSWTQDERGYEIFGQRFGAAGDMQGGEFPANTFTGGSQLSPAIAIDGEGESVIVWISQYQDGDGYGVFAQRYGAFGDPQGSEFPVNAFTTQAQFSPAVAMDSDGDFVVAWASYLEDGSNSGVFAQRFNVGGEPQGSQIPVNTYVQDPQLSPRVAMDDDGDFAVAWQSYGADGDSWGIAVRRFSASGAPLGDEAVANAFVAGVQLNPAVASDADGNLIVAWDSYALDVSSWQIYARASASGGTPPTADANGPYNLDEGGAVILSGTGSAGGSGPLAFHWDLDNDGLFDETGAEAARGNENIQNPTFNAAGLDGPAIVLVSLRTTNGDGLTSATVTATINLNNVAPTVSAGGPYSVIAGNSIQLAGSATDPAGALDNPLIYDWDFNNDGDFADLGEANAGPTPNFNSAGLPPGAHTVGVRATDNDGDSSPIITTFVNIIAAAGAIILDDFDAPGPAGSVSFSSDWAIAGGPGLGRNGNLHLDFNESFLPPQIMTYAFNVPATGRYRVSATWFTNSSLWSSATRFEVSDGATVLGTTLMDQSQPPNDFTDAGSSWEDVGLFDVTGFTGMQLRVRVLSGFDSKYTIADAIRIQKVADLSPQAEINVTMNGEHGATIDDDGGTADFGTTNFNVPVQRTFTISNQGTAPLHLTTPVSIAGSAFTIVTQPAEVIAPGASTTLVVEMSGAVAGVQTGTISFVTDDGDENPFNFALNGTVRTINIVDDGDPGFFMSPAPGELAGWGQAGGPGRDFDFKFNRGNPGSFNEFANWTFNVTPGQYRVSTTWAFGFAGYDNAAPFTIIDGATAARVVGGRNINQQLDPNGTDYPTGFMFPLGTASNQNWERVDIVNITTSTLIVQLLADDPVLFALADSILIDRLGDIPAGPEVVVIESNRNASGGTLSYRQTQLAQPVDKTFTIRNAGLSTLTITSPITIGGVNSQAFTLQIGPSSTSLAPGETSTFVVRMTGAYEGIKHATINFTTNDADEGLVSLPITGEVLPYVISDDLDGGYTSVGLTHNDNVGIAYRNDFSLANTSEVQGPASATWTFDNLSPGSYYVALTWFDAGGDEMWANNTQLIVRDGGVEVANIRFNQRNGPSGLLSFPLDGAQWQILAFFNLASPSATVSITNDSSGGLIILDGVIINRTGGLIPPGNSELIGEDAAGLLMSGDSNLRPTVAEAIDAALLNTAYWDDDVEAILSDWFD